MNTDEIIDHLQQLVKQLGVAKDVEGVADTQIGMGNYKQMMATYQVMLHNLLTLTLKLAENVKELSKPGAGPKTGNFS